jgi:RNA polymerase sigma-70 factor, ECF subfamily
MQQPSDEELVNSFRSEVGSAERDACINQLFTRYHSRVAAWCYRFSGDRALAADLAQDIFLKAYRYLDSFQGGSKFSTWLYSIARNHCINDMKAKMIRPEQSLDSLAAEPADLSQQDTLSALMTEQAKHSARALMEEVLDETEKKVMALHFGQELTIAHITRLLKLTNSSGARAYIVSAKRKLSAALLQLKQTGRA